MAHYEYDAWGNVISVTDQNGNAITSATHIGNLNPFRYRGYYYDSETGFYYLISRYYDPVVHRFINADGYFQSGGDILDTNLSAYCVNNLMIYKDSSGNRYCATTSVGKESRLERKISFIHQASIVNKMNVCTTDLFDVTDRLNSEMKNNAQTLNKLNSYSSICGVVNSIALYIMATSVEHYLMKTFYCSVLE